MEFLMEHWLATGVGVFLLSMVLYGHYRGFLRLAVTMTCLLYTSWNGEILPVAEFERLAAGEGKAGTASPAAVPAAAGAARNYVVIVIRDGQYVCGLQTDAPPFIIRVSAEDRLEGEGYENSFSECRVKDLYRADGKTVALIDVKETLREMAVCE